jgi:hypothetical protein
VFVYSNTLYLHNTLFNDLEKTFKKSFKGSQGLNLEVKFHIPAFLRIFIESRRNVDRPGKIGFK